MIITIIITIKFLARSWWARYMRDKSCLSKAVCLAHLYKVYQFDMFDNHCCWCCCLFASTALQQPTSESTPVHRQMQGHCRGCCMQEDCTQGYCCLAGAAFLCQLSLTRARTRACIMITGSHCMPSDESCEAVLGECSWDQAVLLLVPVLPCVAYEALPSLE